MLTPKTPAASAPRGGAFALVRPGGELHWSWQRFADLGADGVYDMLALRAKVFILEQGPYLDPDGADRQSWHLLGRGSDAALKAYLRVVDPGIKFDAPSIGRVVVDKAQRGTGLGHALVAEGIRRCVAAWPGRGIRIAAQAHLQRYYGRHGFVADGAEFLEDGIAHIEMWRAA